MEGMYAGVEGSGAEDAWWETALHIEHNASSAVPFSGGATDVFKCFDQICRPLLYYLATVAGIPRRILDAYRRYQENADIYNSLGLGLGKPRRRPNGIPQGCPLSMLFVALLLRPWMAYMHTLNVKPRTLADDLLLFAAGHDHIGRIIHATECTHTYLSTMGAKVATSKSILFASCN